MTLGKNAPTARLTPKPDGSATPGSRETVVIPETSRNIARTRQTIPPIRFPLIRISLPTTTRFGLMPYNHSMPKGGVLIRVPAPPVGGVTNLSVGLEEKLVGVEGAEPIKRIIRDARGDRTKRSLTRQGCVNGIWHGGRHDLQPLDSAPLRWCFIPLHPGLHYGSSYGLRCSLLRVVSQRFRRW